MKINSKNLRLFYAISIVVLLNSYLYGQRPKADSDSDTVSCQQGNGEKGPYKIDTAFGIGSTSEASLIVKAILELDDRTNTLVKVQPSRDIPSIAVACLATNDTTFRVLFQPSYFQIVKADSFEYWRDRAILAHEVGHIANNDFTTSDKGSTPKIELRADEYAGKILAKMGATLEQAQSPFRDKIFDCGKCESHPPIPQRLEAVKKGWEEQNKIAESDFYKVWDGTSSDFFHGRGTINGKFLTLLTSDKEDIVIAGPGELFLPAGKYKVTWEFDDFSTPFLAGESSVEAMTRGLKIKLTYSVIGMQSPRLLLRAKKNIYPLNSWENDYGVVSLDFEVKKDDPPIRWTFNVWVVGGNLRLTIKRITLKKF